MNILGGINESALRELSERYRTPCYLYSIRALRERIREIRGAFSFPGVTLFFATMANDHPEILREMANQGLGACVNSLRHLKLALACGIAPELIQFTSTGLSRQDMEELVRLAITINLDSPRQISQWCSLAPGGGVGLRLNAASLLGRDDGDRIGMDVAEIGTIQQIVREHDSRIEGAHVYTGTNFQSTTAMLPTLRAFFATAATLPDLRYVNIGGGIGIDYSHSGEAFDLGGFGSEISEMAAQLCARIGRPISVLFEPGRSLTAATGMLLARVTDIKLLHGVTYVAVDASIAIFPRPFHHPESPHRVRKVGVNGDAGRFEPITIVGHTTFSRDILAHAMIEGHLEIDDLLVFEDAGAYCQSMMSRFLGQDNPNVVAIE